MSLTRAFRGRDGTERRAALRLSHDFKMENSMFGNPNTCNGIYQDPDSPSFCIFSQSVVRAIRKSFAASPIWPSVRSRAAMICAFSAASRAWAKDIMSSGPARRSGKRSEGCKSGPVAMASPRSNLARRSRPPPDQSCVRTASSQSAPMPTNPGAWRGASLRKSC